jgi:hypothetical protein
MSSTLGPSSLPLFDIGGAIPLRHNIFLKVDENAPENFLSSVRSSLDIIETTSVGRRLIEKIGTATHPIFIQYAQQNSSELQEIQGSRMRGVGTCTIISHSSLNSSRYISTHCLPAVKPSFAILAHELIHAYHNSVGKNADNTHRCDSFVWANDEEYHTIMGFPSKKPGRLTPKITENAILAELGLPERFGEVTFDTLEKNPLVYRRVQLAAHVYNRFCTTSSYEGQSHNPPPPITNITREDLGPSDTIVVVYNISAPRRRLLRVMIHGFTDQSMAKDFGISIPNDALRLDLEIGQCPPALQLKSLDPKYDDEQFDVQSIGIYRLSRSEAEVAGIGKT